MNPLLEVKSLKNRGSLFHSHPSPNQITKIKPTRVLLPLFWGNYRNLAVSIRSRRLRDFLAVGGRSYSGLTIGSQTHLLSSA